MQDKRWLFWIVLAGIASRIVAWIYFNFHPLELVTSRLPDDALYYCAIAQNFAHGYGISFDGVHPTNGMHPLWVLLLTPLFWLDLTKWGYIQAGMALQCVLDASIIWMIGSTVYEALPMAKESNRRTAASSAALIYALSFLVLLRGINGMETTLAALLFVVWFHTVLNAWNRDQWTDWVLLGIVTGFLLLARTDSFIVLLPLSIYLLLTKWRSSSGRMLLASFIALIVVAPWLIWNLSTFGTIMQSSGEAVPMLALRKLHALYGPIIVGHLLSEATRNVLKPFWYAALGLPLLTIFYAIPRRHSRPELSETAIYFLVLGGILLLVVHSLFRGFIRDWYVVELIPVFLIAFGISMGANAGATEARSSGRWSVAAFILAFQVLLYHRPEYPSQAALVQSGIPLVEQLAQHAKVATFNSGYYGYFSERRGSIVNLDGVVNSDALGSLQSGALASYLDRDSVFFIFDFKGDFGGYINLFDRHLLDNFTLDSTIPNPYDSTDPLVLYRRMAFTVKKK